MAIQIIIPKVSYGILVNLGYIKMDIIKLDKNLASKEPGKDLFWFDASLFTIEGKGWDDTESVYDRLPAKAKDIVRTPVWDLSKCPAGISIRFSTNSSSLAVKWDGFYAFNNMTALGASGLDLYVKYEGQWKWLSVGKPSKELNEVELFSGMTSESRDFILYLPLYNPVKKIELGIPGSFEMKATPPREKKPIVFYGTSITQGTSASRPGMCYSAILGRWLDNPVINLGFSGNGIMEEEVIGLLSELDPILYVLDTMPNMEESSINKREEAAIRKLRMARVNTPIVLVDSLFYCDAFLIKSRMNRCISSNKAQRDIYDKLVKEGVGDLYHIKGDSLIGSDGEGTIDGTHFTDLGYMRFSERLVGLLAKLIESSDCKG